MPENARRWNTALVGCGRIARVHAERIVADSRGSIVAVYDVNRDAATALTREFSPGAHVCGTLEELLKTPGLDVAIVCTPTQDHYEHVLACRERGLHVLCEKPLADTRERIVDLINAAQSGPRLSVAYQRRCWATHRTLRREVLSGRWGPVQAVMSHNVEAWQQTIAGTWRDDPATNRGGFIGDAGSHKIDSVFHITGLAPAEVFARVDNSGSAVEVVANASALLEGGVPLNISFVGNAQYLGEDLAIHCAEADLLIRDWKPWIGRAGKIAPLTPLEPESNPVAAFYDLLDGAAENFAPPECALPVFDFTAALLESSRNGGSVSIARAARSTPAAGSAPRR